jgi:hypothetical protein
VEDFIMKEVLEESKLTSSQNYIKQLVDGVSQAPGF